MSERGDVHMPKEKFIDKIKALLVKHSDVLWCVAGAIAGCVIVGFIGTCVVGVVLRLIFSSDISDTHPFISDVLWVLFAVGGGVAGTTIAIKFLPMRGRAVDFVRKFKQDAKKSKSEKES